MSVKKRPMGHTASSSKKDFVFNNRLDCLTEDVECLGANNVVFAKGFVWLGCRGPYQGE